MYTFRAAAGRRPQSGLVHPVFDAQWHRYTRRSDQLDTSRGIRSVPSAQHPRPVSLADRTPIFDRPPPSHLRIASPRGAFLGRDTPRAMFGATLYTRITRQPSAACIPGAEGAASYRRAHRRVLSRGRLRGVRPRPSGGWPTEIRLALLSEASFRRERVRGVGTVPPDNWDVPRALRIEPARPHRLAGRAVLCSYVSHFITKRISTYVSNLDHARTEQEKTHSACMTP